MNASMFAPIPGAPRFFDLTAKGAITKDMPAVVRLLEQLLLKISDASGEQCTLTVADTGCFPPFTTDKGLHFVIGAAAPGSYEMTYRTHACGYRVHHRLNFGIFCGPTRGYGILVTDTEREETKPCAQIIGRTVYLILPTPAQSPTLFEGFEGFEMYERAMRLVLAELQKSGPTIHQISCEPGTEATEASYVDMLKEHLGTMPMIYEEIIQNIDAEILDATKKLAEAHRRRRANIELLAQFKNRAALYTDEDLQKDWQALMAHPKTDAVFLAKNCVIVRTKTLYYDDTPRRKFGSYYVIMMTGQVPCVWAHKPAHPALIAHPHISKKGGECYGNVTAALAEAVSGYTLYKPYDIVVRWLEEGYDPSIADTKIEEWPIEEGGRHEDERQGELFASA